jgi:preprotein translocase subunit SecA
MTFVQITSQINIELEQLLSGVSQLETADLEKLAEQIDLLIAQRKAASLPHQEAELLQKINQGLPEDIQRHYDKLREKLQSETITPEEYQELLALIDTVEQADADRLQHLLELSQLRQVPFNNLMTQLDLHPPAVSAHPPKEG